MPGPTERNAALYILHQGCACLRGHDKVGWFQQRLPQRLLVVGGALSGGYKTLDGPF